MKDIKARYENLTHRREAFLQRARDAAALTIPTTLPPEGTTGTTDLVSPYQGLGARGVNNLTNRLLLTMFPANSPFFKFMIDEATLAALGAPEDVQTEIDQSLVQMERQILQEMEVDHVRIAEFEALEHLVIGGNACLYYPEEGRARIFPLSQYVVERDGMDKIGALITVEEISWEAVPQAMQAALTADGHGSDPEGARNLELYTGVWWDQNAGLYRSKQQLNGRDVPGSEGSYRPDLLPWQAHRYIKISGEDYGRGAVEPHIGDLRALESLTKASVEGAAAAARILVLVDPGSPTRKVDLEEAPNGAVVTGREQDVTFLQASKSGDLAIARDLMQRLEERLSFAFLLNSAVQRSGERVTAEEIRTMTSELEATLGGSFSMMALDMQLPLVRLILGRLERDGKTPEFPEGIVRPSIVTGLEALGRGSDFNRLTQYLQTLQGTIGPEAIDRYVNVSEVTLRLANAAGIDSTDLIKSPEQVAQEQQIAQQQQMMDSLGPNAINAMAQQAQAPPA